MWNLPAEGLSLWTEQRPASCEAAHPVESLPGVQNHFWVGMDCSNRCEWFVPVLCFGFCFWLLGLGKGMQLLCAAGSTPVKTKRLLVRTWQGCKIGL